MQAGRQHTPTRRRGHTRSRFYARRATEQRSQRRAVVRRRREGVRRAYAVTMHAMQATAWRRTR